MKSKAPSGKNRRFLGRPGLSSILIGPLVILLAAASGLAYLVFSLPLSSNLQSDPLLPSAMFRSSDGETFAARGIFRGGHLDYDDLPEHLVQSVIAIEDRRFFQHFGIDLRAIFRAGYKNFNAGEIKEGASTITQQLAKLSFFSPERSYKRKLQEILVALWLENRMSKEQIISRYLDQAYFGSGAYGVDGAARVFFDKTVNDLTLYESAILAGTIRAPSLLNPLVDFEASKDRANVVLAAMVESGTISEQQAEEAKRTSADLTIPQDTTSSAQYFADWVYGQLRDTFGPTSANLQVSTTLDSRLQEIAEDTIERVLKNNGSANQASQASLVAMSPSGAVLAMVGGRSYEASQFNRAFQAQRQPGSLFKLFVYLTALSKGLEPDTQIIDEPVKVGDWAPKNYGGKYLGAVTLRKSFSKSINSVAVKLVQRVGADHVVQMARSLGVRSPLTQEPSLALGTSEVNLLEMTAAYAAVAANKDIIRPFGIAGIGNLEGLSDSNNIGTAAPQNNPPSWPRNKILSLLEQSVRSGTARRSAIGIPSAGKTGTTQDHRDAWYVGFTPDIVVGVWVGNDDNSPMKKVTGGTLPAQIWKEFVSAAIEIRLPNRKSFTVADTLPRDRPKKSAAPIPKQADNAVNQPAQQQTATSKDHQKKRENWDGSRRTALKGNPRVLDTAHLLFGTQVVALVGVEGQRVPIRSRLVQLHRRACRILPAV